jgi:transcriptional regulator with XRE-family HTH domain
MPHDMQSFAGSASKTLHQAHADNCRVPSKKLPARKQSPETLESVQVFRDNIRALFREAQSSPERKITQKEFAKIIGVSLRTLAAMLAEAADGEDGAIVHAATLRTIERTAKGFEIEPWQLLFPDFPSQLILNPKYRDQVQEVVARYLHASDTVRDALAEMLPPAPARLKTTV